MWVQIGDLEQELVWSLLAKPPVPPREAKSNQAPDSGLFESSGTRGYTAGGPLSEKWSEIFPQEQGRRGLRLDDKSWTSYLRCPPIIACCFQPCRAGLRVHLCAMPRLGLCIQDGSDLLTFCLAFLGIAFSFS